MATHMVTVDWARIHAAAELVDAARGSDGAHHIGYDGTSDAFGGTYRATAYSTLADVVRLVVAAQSIRSAAWTVVHGAHRAAEAASVVRSTDRGSWMVVDCPCGEDRRYGSRRGARCAATRSGGRAVMVPGTGDAAARRARVLAHARAAVETAIACHQLMLALASTGLVTYQADREVCGVHEGRIGLTGIGWLSGESRESDVWPTIEHARQAVSA